MDKDGIFGLKLNVVSRGSGHSAVASAAYNSGTKLYESDQSKSLRSERRKILEKQLPKTKGDYLSLKHQLLHLEEGRKEQAIAFKKLSKCERKLDAYDSEKANKGVHDYRPKGTSQGILHTEILLPDEAPEWMQDREQLWNAAEEAEETRINGRTAREAVVSLPHKLCQTTQIELAKRFGEWLRDRYNVAVDVAVHPAHKGGDKRNVHAHIMFSTREITPDGFGEKTKALDDKSGGKEVLLMRKTWAELVNDALSSSGSTTRVDHRSLKDRGINQIPNIKIGKAATAMERRGIKTIRGDKWRAIEAENQARVNNDNPPPETLNDDESLKRAANTHWDLIQQEAYLSLQQQTNQNNHGKDPTGTER